MSNLRDRALVEGASVVLELGSGDALNCSVIEFRGEFVRLRTRASLAPTAGAGERIGTCGLLIFEIDGGLHAQEVVLVDAPDRTCVIARVRDHSRVGHRRAHCRAPLALEVELTPSRVDPALDACSGRTVDVSAGGLRAVVEDDVLLPVDLDVSLRLPNGNIMGPLPARVVRGEGRELSMRFDDAVQTASLQLASLVLEWHLRRRFG